jgi:hypothetical protein
MSNISRVHRYPPPPQAVLACLECLGRLSAPGMAIFKRGYALGNVLDVGERNGRLAQLTKNKTGRKTPRSLN